MRHSLWTNLSAYQNYKSLSVMAAMGRVLALRLIQLLSRQALLPSLTRTSKAQFSTIMSPTNFLLKSLASMYRVEK